MPYIKQTRRSGLKEHCDQIALIARDENFGQEEVIEIVTTLVACTASLALLPTLKHAAPVTSPLCKLIMELNERGDREEAIGGDLNFAVCRILVGFTQIHEAPRYESKIQFIDEIIDYAQRSIFAQFDNPVSINTGVAWANGVLKCAGRELYRRYGGPYEDIARAREDSGDIMD
jgi:hypothetical protein